MRRLLILLLLFASAVAAKSPASKPAESAPAPLTEQEAITVARARLAASGRFYLELDLKEERILLCHSGTFVAFYPLRDLSIGNPRLFFFSKGRGMDWVGDLWTDGHLEPEREIHRVKIVPGDESTVPTPDTPGLIPPSMDEIIPVPPVYEIRFKGGKAIQLVLAGEIPGAQEPRPKWTTRWREFLAGLGLAPADSVRLKATVPSKDGAALYRSFPDYAPEMLVYR